MVFKPGDRVVVVQSGYDRKILGEDTVDKFYKNGNFVLQGGTQQFRPSGQEAGEKISWGTFKHVVHHDDPEVERMRVRAERKDLGQRVCALADQIRVSSDKISTGTLKSVVARMIAALNLAREEAS